MLQRIGADAGVDSNGDFPQARALSRYLDQKQGMEMQPIPTSLFWEGPPPCGLDRGTDDTEVVPPQGKAFRGRAHLRVGWIEERTTRRSSLPYPNKV